MDHRDYLAKIGRRGGKKRSKRKAEATRRNVALARATKLARKLAESKSASKVETICHL